jgi:hypothetical protein
MWSLLMHLDLNECAVGADDCNENSVCKNTRGSFECDCKNGFYKESGSNQCMEGTLAAAVHIQRIQAIINLETWKKLCIHNQ